MRSGFWLDWFPLWGALLFTIALVLLSIGFGTSDGLFEGAEWSIPVVVTS